MKASVPVSRPQIRTFAQATDLDRALCQFVSESLGQAIELRGKSTLVVSGGSTPLGFLRLLAQQQLPWSQCSLPWLMSAGCRCNTQTVMSAWYASSSLIIRAHNFYPCGVLSRLVLSAAAVTGTNAGQ